MSVKTKNIKKVILASTLVSGASGLALMNVGTSYAAESYISGSKNSTQTWVDSTESLGWQYDVVDSDSTKCIIKPSSDAMKTGDVVIPSTIDGYTVVAVMSGAFENCTGLTSVTLPDTCTELGNSAFAGCTGLTSIKGTENINMLGQKVFYNCSSLTGKLTFGDVDSLYYDLFYNCSGIEELEFGNINTIMNSNSWADFNSAYHNWTPFRGCTGLKKIKMGDVASAGSRKFNSDGGRESNKDTTFWNLENLETLELGSYPGSLPVSRGCDSLKSITVESVDTLEGTYAYGDGSKPEKWYSSLPTSLEYFKCGNVNTINAAAFAGLTNLKYVEVDLGGSLPDYIFKNCTLLKSTETNIKVGDITSIGTGAFLNSGVTDIKTGNLTQLGDKAFSNCKSLKTVEIGNIDSFGHEVFDSCTALEDIKLGDLDSFYAVNTNTSGIGSAIYSSQFKGASNLKSIELGNVNTIGVSAFQNIGSALTTVKVGNVGTIGDKAFADNTNLESFVSGSITSLSTSAFDNTKIGQMVSVNLNYDGKTVTKTVAKGTKASDLGKVTVEDKVFCGWYTDEACEHPFVNSITEDMTLYAGLADDVYFTNQNGDRVEIGSTTPKVGDTLTLNIDGKPAGDVTYTWRWLRPWYGTVPVAPNYELINETSNSFTITEPYRGRNINISAQMNGYNITTNYYVIVDGVADDNNGPKVDMNGVSLSATSYDVGGIITAVTDPEDATGTYQWKESDTQDGEYINIEGATNKTYEITLADKDKYIKVEFTGSGLYRDQVLESESSLIFGEAKDINTTLEVKRGSDYLSNVTPKVGDTFVATTSSENDGHVTYQWYRSTTNRGSSASFTINEADEAISGATGTSYTFTKDDLGKYVYVVMSGKSNLGYNGCVNVSSRYVTTTTTTNGIDMKDQKGNYAGNSSNYVGDIFTVVLPDGITEDDVNIKWYRADSKTSSYTADGNNYDTFDQYYSGAEEITGETGLTYTVKKADFGKYIFAVAEDKPEKTNVAYKSKAYGTGYAIGSSSTSYSYMFNNTTNNDAYYSDYVGNTLSVKLPDGITADDVDIRWFRNKSKSSTNTVSNDLTQYNDFDSKYIPSTAERIDGASDITYELQKADFGKYIFAVVTDKSSSEKVYKSITSSSGSPIYATVTDYSYLFNDTRNDSAYYSDYVGNTLSVKLPDGITADDVDIRWFRNTSKSSTNTVSNDLTQYNDFDSKYIPSTAEQIDGASSDKYVLTLDDAGKYIYAVVSDKASSKKVYKSITSSTGYGIIAQVDTFNIVGKQYVGKELSVTTNFGDLKFNTYQWYRSSYAGSVGDRISGATSSTYTLTSADVGYYISCYVDSPESPYTGNGYASSTEVVKKITDCTEIGDEHVEGEWVITKAPTCEEPGSRSKYCTVCGSLLDTEEIDPTGHKFELVDGKYICTNEKNAVQEPVNDTTYPWTKVNGMWKSNIQGIGNDQTSLTYNFDLTKSTEFSFDWYSNGEGSYDSVKCDISKDGSKIETINYGDSDRSTSITVDDVPDYLKHVTRTLEAGSYTVTFRYYKDSSNDVGMDSAFIANVKAAGQCGVEKTVQQITKAGLTGTAKVGKTLTLNTVPADATGTIEWWTSEDGETWMNILDTNDRTYTLTEDEEGKYIKATITGTGDYTGTAEAVTPFKVSGIYSTISNPKMSMTENVGETMRFTYEPADATLEFKWQRSQDGSTWTDIEGETSNEYTVKSEDQGYMIRMTVQGTGDYKNFKYTSPTATIKEDVTSIDLEVTGTKQVGKVLRAKITPEDVEVKYSWLIGDSKDGDFTEVSTSSSYKLTESDGGKFIKLKVTGVSDPTLVAESEPAKVKRIIKSLVITGIPKVGKTLTAVIDPAEATGNFQWEISDDNGVFSPIDGADSEDYTIKKSDAGHWIKVTWTGTGDWEGMKVTLTSGGGKTNSSTTIPGKNGTIASEEWKDEDVKVDWTTKVEGGTVSDSTTTLPDNSTTTKGDETPSESGDISTAKPGDVITFPKPNVPDGATNGRYEWKYKDDDPDSPKFGEWVLIDGEYGEDLTINEELKNKVIRRDYIFEDEEGNTFTISNAVYIQDEDEEDTKTNPGERIPTSKEKVDYTVIGTDEVYNGYKQGVKVYVSQGQDIAVQLPFKTVLDGRRGVDNKADFHVQVRANIAGDDNIKVIPETEFTLSTNGKADISGEVTVDQTEFNIAQDGEQELSTGKIIDGRVEAFGVSAGHWEGGFSWTISVEGLKISDSTENTEDTTIDTFEVNDKQFKNVMKSVRIATSSNAVAE